MRDDASFRTTDDFALRASALSIPQAQTRRQELHEPRCFMQL